MTPATLNIPLFPLPETVFFPHTLLPLHVFEPRYKEMVSDALASDRIVGVVQLRPGWDENYFGAPPIYKTLGVGEIIEADRWSDGRYDIIVSGLYRTHITQELEGQPYRQAEVQVVSDFVPLDKAREVAEVHGLLLKIFEKLSTALPKDLSILHETDVNSLTPGMLTDVMASLLVNDPYERQSLLSEPDVARRQQLLRIQIQTLFNPIIPED